MTKRNVTGVQDYLSWVISVISSVDRILERFERNADILEDDLSALFELMLLLDEAPINKHWTADHPAQGLLSSIEGWAEDSRVSYAGIKAVTAMIRTHPFNESKQDRERARMLQRSGWALK